MKAACNWPSVKIVLCIASLTEDHIFNKKIKQFGYTSPVLAMVVLYIKTVSLLLETYCITLALSKL